jgi:chromosome segregation ATPase
MITLITTKKLEQISRDYKTLEQNITNLRQDHTTTSMSLDCTKLENDRLIEHEKALCARIEELEKQVEDGLQKIYDLEHPTVTDENFVKLVFDNELNVAKPIVGFTDVTKDMLIEHSRVVPDGNEMWSTQLIIMTTAHEALTQILEPFTHTTE